MISSFYPLLYGYASMMLVSVLLVAFYLIFLSRKHSYRFQRSYLLAIPVVCLLQVGAYFAKSYVEKQQAPEVLTMTQAEADAYLTAHPEAVMQQEVIPTLPEPQVATEIPTEEVAPTKAPTVISFTEASLRTALSIALPAVSAVLLLIIIVPLVQLRFKMRKLSFEGDSSNGNILRAAWIQTPFSFGRLIFLPAGRTPADERLFIQHEQAHIACRHYIDVWTIELLTRLLWFNPVLWMVRKTLRDLHEFEADRLVLEQGADAYTYQCLLVGEASEDCSIIANGFNNSFIRRRIKEMKCTERNGISRFGKLLATLWVLALTGGTFAFALPQKPTTIVQVMRDTRTLRVDTCYAEESVVPVHVAIHQPSFIVHTNGDSAEFTSIVSETPDSMYSQRLFIKFPSRSKEEATAISSRIQAEVETVLKQAEVQTFTNKVAPTPNTPSSTPQQKATEEPYTPTEANANYGGSREVDNPYATPTHGGWRYIMNLPKHDANDKRLIKLRHSDNETFITFAKKIHSDRELVRFGGPDSYIVDTATGVHYKARRSIPGSAWHYFYVKDMKDETIEVTVVFPRIPDSTEWIELYQITRDLQTGDMLKVAEIME